MKKIALIVGSLSQHSIHRKLAQIIVQHLPENFTTEEVIIGDLPLYTQDWDQVSVPEYDRVRTQLRDADAVLIVSPEHNRCMPAALKNVLDIASRPYGQSVWQNKKVAIATASVGVYGGINAGLDLRQCLNAMNADVLRQPEVYLSRVNAEIDANTEEFLAKFAMAFAAFVRGE